jgi:hypothetical protein
MATINHIIAAAKLIIEGKPLNFQTTAIREIKC